MPRRRILAGSGVCWAGGRISRQASLAEKPAVKSPLIIVALGAVGCVLMGILMKEAMAIDSQLRQLPFQPALTARFGTHLDGPLRVQEERLHGVPGLLASGGVRAGVVAEPLARAIGAELWLHAMRGGSVAVEARVVLHGADGRQLVSLRVPRPAPRPELVSLPPPPR